MFLTLAFLEQDEFYPETCGPLYALRKWSFDDDRIRTVRMEDLVTDVNRFLGSILASIFGAKVVYPDANEFSFFRITGGRLPGELDSRSHYRSGLPNQWRKELPPGVVEYVRAHFKPILERYYPEALR